jgi:hypothetical protein
MDRPKFRDQPRSNSLYRISPQLRALWPIGGSKALSQAITIAWPEENGRIGSAVAVDREGGDGNDEDTYVPRLI